MGLVHIFERGGDEIHRFESALNDAKESLWEVCELYEGMKAQFSERGSYSSRGSYSGRSGYRDYDEMSERRGRDSMGRYR